MIQLVKKNNKAVLLVCSCFVSLIGFTGCEKYLEMPVKDKVPQEKLFNDEQGFKDALTGVYLGMDKPSSGGRQGLYTNDLSFGIVSVLANNYTNASTSALGDGIYAASAKYDYEHSMLKQEINGIWSGMYSNVSNLNNLLGQIDAKQNVFYHDNYRRVKGEALALRALFHFDLARLFAQSPAVAMNERAIPYVTKFGTTSSSFKPLSAVLDSCIADLNQAKALLAKADTTKINEGSLDLFSGFTQNHMNYWATKALLARVYLYKGDHNNAMINAAEVIGSNKFPLITSNVASSSAQTRDRLFSKELLFSLYSTNTGKYSDGLFNMSSGAPLQFSVASKNALYGSVSGDYRLSWFDKNNNNVEVPSKYFQDAGLPYVLQNIIPLIRVSEMYYIAAECAGNSGDINKGLDYLNKVRNARGLAPLTIDNVPDVAALSLEITKEYKKEFIHEGQLFFFYKRLNKDLKTESGTTAIVPENAYVLPIPDKETEYNQ